MLVRIRFVNLNIASSGELLFLNPYWSIVIILFVCTCFASLLWITFSNIFENAGNKDIGLYADMSALVPDLKMGEICEYFNLDGKLPEVNILFII
jgi:hypothetical protein